MLLLNTPKTSSRSLVFVAASLSLKNFAAVVVKPRILDLLLVILVFFVSFSKLLREEEEKNPTLRLILSRFDDPYR